MTKSDEPKKYYQPTALQRRTRERNFMRRRLKGVAATLRHLPGTDDCFREQLLPADLKNLESAIALVLRLDTKLADAQRQDSFWSKVDSGKTIKQRNSRGNKR